MSKIFISYRRIDSAGFSGRLWENLCIEFGTDNIFMDVENGIAKGEDFPDVIQKKLNESSVVLVVIGDKWLNCIGTNGTPRIKNENDWVRSEIKTALDKKSLLIPVLIDDAKMPDKDDIPENIQKFCYKNAITLRSTSWASDVSKLVSTLNKILWAERVRVIAIKTIPIIFATIFSATIGGWIIWDSKFFSANRIVYETNFKTKSEWNGLDYSIEIIGNKCSYLDGKTGGIHIAHEPSGPVYTEIKDLTPGKRYQVEFTVRSLDTRDSGKAFFISDAGIYLPILSNGINSATFTAREKVHRIQFDWALKIIKWAPIHITNIKVMELNY